MDSKQACSLIVDKCLMLIPYNIVLQKVQFHLKDILKWYNNLNGVTSNVRTHSSFSVVFV